MSFGPPTPLTYENRYFAPSDSAVVTLTVQDQPIGGLANNPVPTGYWTTPINAENKGWQNVADNWLMPSYDHPGRMFTAGNAFSPYTSAPESAHVLWDTQVVIGGLAGGPLGDRSYYTGLAYEQFYTPIIIQGQILYSDHGPTSGTNYGTRALDLYTGKQLWYLPNITFAFAQVLEIDNPNEHGALPYLWSTGSGGGFFSMDSATWTMWDAFSANTGQPPRMYLTVANVTTGTTRFGPNGELLNFALSGTGANQRLLCWNSTKAIYRTGAIDTWGPALGSTLDGRMGIEFNVSAPTTVRAALSISDINVKEGYLLASYTDNTVYPRITTDTAYKLPAKVSGSYPTTVSALWTQNRTIEATLLFTTFIQDGVYARFLGSTLMLYCYDIKTGVEKWATGPITNNGWAYFIYLVANAYGKIYTAGYDGHVRAFNVADGSQAWDFYFGSSGLETAYGSWPTYNGFSIADGKVFIGNDEHSPDSILWRGGKTYAIEAATGANVWNISGWLRNTAISNGYLTSLNNLDGLAYTIGKGPSKTTVTAPLNAVTLGQSLTITGTVTDQSPGQPDTPAISDANMGEWMEYIHMQKPKPTNAVGVPVTLTAVDSSGKTEEIGVVTSNMYGNFGASWTPKVSGLYQIIATFAGTNSYGDSAASTFVTVSPAAAASAPATSTPIATPTPTVTSTATVQPTPSPAVNPTSGSDTAVYVGLAALVIILAVAAIALVLRRRK
jgi:hypothetical protein